MKTIDYKSQAGQDRFAHALLGDGPHTFLDIGMNDPIIKSNTYALESECGWRGLLVDNDAHCCQVLYPQSGRPSPILWNDATQVDWRSVLQQHDLWPVIDYLSLDVDENTLATLRKMPLTLRFKVITIEHDAYRFGPGPRDAQRDILRRQGYELVAGNVRDQSMAFEDWWVDPELVHETQWGRFRGYDREWQTVIGMPLDEQKGGVS